MNPKVVLCGASSIAGIENFGDQLLRDLYAKWIGSASPAARTEMVYFGNKLRPIKALDDVMSDASAFIFVGGGYFHEKTIFHRRFLVDLAMRLAWGARNSRVYVRAFRAAASRNLPTAVCGTEVGPLVNPVYRRQVLQVLRASRLCIVRSRESAEFARRHGVDRDDLNVCADAVLSLRRSDLPKESCDTLAKWSSPAGTFRLGLHIHQLRSSEWNEKLLRLVDHIRESLPPSTPLRIYYLHDQLKGRGIPQRSVDAERFICDRIPGTEAIPYEAPWPMVGVIGAMNLVLTTKLHVGIVGRALDIAVLSLLSDRVKSYPERSKQVRFFRLIGEPASCSTVDQFLTVGLPDDIIDHLKGWNPDCRLPVSGAARASAERNRELLTQFVHTVLPASSRQDESCQPVQV